VREAFGRSATENWKDEQGFIPEKVLGPYLHSSFPP